MWTVDRPETGAGAAFSLCIQRVKSAELKARLTAIKPDVEAAAEDYVLHAESESLQLCSVHTSVGSVSAAELSNVYTGRMAKLGAPGRILYDELLASPKGGTCPLCGHRQVGTLDHFLPKESFPSLAVAPDNLIPACSDCNKTKHNHVPTLPSEVTIHPYFDDLSDDTWLEARVIQTKPAAVSFHVAEPPGWSSLMGTRARYHFDLFKLPSLYSAQAASELSGIRFALATVNGSDGADGVKRHLTLQAKSRRRASKNSWQTATYQALADSPWFCAGGFT
jgi:hypothetical protein